MDETTLPSVPTLQPRQKATHLAFVVLWAEGAPHRVGEVALLRGGRSHVLGRGPARAGNPGERLEWIQQRPGQNISQPPLTVPTVSRVQATVTVAGSQLRVQRLGEAPLSLGGVVDDQLSLVEGDVLNVANGHLLLLLTRRQTQLDPLPGELRLHRFGFPDAHGIVGESPAAWRLRDCLAFFGRRGAHVLITGESGVGKELAARALHRLSSVGARPLVSRNAATLPPGIIDAELFGNARGYPNSGSPERKGLIGVADGSSLFLDEMGELPVTLQTHLLRVLDSGGEYHRLGESRARRSSFRLIAATNRNIAELKSDLAARLTLRLQISGLNERREDIPLLVVNLLRQTKTDDPPLYQRFVRQGPEQAVGPRVDPGLVEALVSHHYSLHVRELKTALWKAIAESKDHIVRAHRTHQVAVAAVREHRSPGDIGEEELRESLVEHDWNRERARRSLGLSSRHALYRLMRKYGVETPE